MKAIIVTGAASGIGKALCAKIKEEGEYKYIGVDINEEKLNNLYTDSYIACDLSDIASIKKVFSYCLQNELELYGIVHCAGICKVQNIMDISERDMLLTYKVNVLSFIEMYKSFCEYPLRSEAANLLAISSITANRAYKNQLLYASSKAALESCVKSIGQDGINKGIRANVLELGAVKTEMFDSLSPNYETINNHYPLGLLESSEAASILYNLLEEPYQRMTGSIIKVDSGFTIVH